ncbi:MAG: hypothetical protein HC769_30440 [Cyanobacteria bacterium CRU_2_1]|nr:hypothetical protein [Cyanobacteria bacterium CRU_2_1]
MKFITEPQELHSVGQSEAVANQQVFIVENQNHEAQVAANNEDTQLEFSPFVSMTATSSSTIEPTVLRSMWRYSQTRAVPSKRSRKRSQSSLVLVIPFPSNATSDGWEGDRETIGNMLYLYPRGSNDTPLDCA